jgi:carbonic anhydrase/acetyltransferase-like protein (isoleucine patch superfamily)
VPPIRVEEPVSLPQPLLTRASLDWPESAILLGALRAGPSAIVAQGAVVRSESLAAALGAGSALLENAVLIAAPGLQTTIGERAVFGHRCLIIGARVGDLCEIGNGAILMPGARVGDGCFLGEGALVPEGAVLPDGVVAVGRPARVVRRANDGDRARLLQLRGGDLSLPRAPLAAIEGRGAPMGKLYPYGGKLPQIAPGAVLFQSAELTGDVTVGEGTIIGAGVKIIGDSHGPVRIGAGVQILENTVLHLLPDNELVIEDGCTIGPGAMIHGCRLGRGTVVEPGAIVCDFSALGENCLVKAGSVVKQRSRFPAGAVLEGFPARQIDTLTAPQPLPAWALVRDRLGDLLERS